MIGVPRDIESASGESNKGVTKWRPDGLMRCDHVPSGSRKAKKRPNGPSAREATMGTPTSVSRACRPSASSHAIVIWHRHSSELAGEHPAQTQALARPALGGAGTPLTTQRHEVTNWPTQ